MGKEKSKKKSKYTTSEDSGSNSAVTSKDKQKFRKLKKKLKEERRKEQKQTKRALKKKLKEEKRLKEKDDRLPCKRTSSSGKVEAPTADIPLELMERSKAMAPMTKEEWEKRQSVIKRVLDEESGRYRLIKGDGEVIEEIVSRNRHKQINRQATEADGTFFQSQTVDRDKI